MLKDNTYQLQSAMSGYVRTGEKIALPVDSDFRLGQYRRLVFNVVKGTLDQAYPIAARHLGEDKWSDLVEDFFAHHACRHPQVWRMPRELIDFIQEKNYAAELNLPHLNDLLRMEWLEIEVHSMPDQTVKPFGEIGDLMNTALCFNPHFKLEKFNYPVHKIHEINPAENAKSSFILIFRDDNTGRVHFIYLEPINAVLLDSMIQNTGATATEVIEAVLESHGVSREPLVKKHFEDLLNHLLDRKFILGAAIL